MKKIIIQGLLTVLLFGATWLLLSQADWVGIFKVRRVTDQTEQKLGNIFWDYVKKTEKENNNTQVTRCVDSMVSNICKANDIDRTQIQVHVLNKEEINAFALPGGHLIINSGLIKHAESQEEMTGVICHELAHIELHHVMNKLVKEIGLSVLVSMTTGNTGTEVMREAAKILSSSAFDRSLEKEADIKAVDYMMKAEVNPEPFANFLYRLSEKEPEDAQYFRWMSTHPDSKQRAAYILEHIQGHPKHDKTMVSAHSWEQMRKEIKE